MRDGPPAIVIGVDTMVGLQAARLLARRGVSVVGVAADRRHFAARTRVCERIVEGAVDGDGLVGLLEGLLFDDRPVLVPCTDRSVLDVARHRDRLAGAYRIPLPSYDVVRTLSDKAALAVHAERHGLPIPPTVVVRSREDAERAAATLPYPAVLKPALKTPLWSTRTRAKALRAGSPDELLATYDRVAGFTDTLVAQQFVPGGDDRLLTCNAYFGADGSPLVTFVTRKRRQWPPGVGIGSYGEECRDDAVRALTLRLFGSLPFHGLGYLEVKRSEGGDHRIIEANVGRPTGRSATAEAGGVELLATMYSDAADLPLPAAREQRYVGASWIDLRRDALAAAHGWRRGDLRATDWLRSFRGPTAHAVLSARDPLPFVFEVGQSGAKAAARARRRLPAHRRSPRTAAER